MIHAREVLSNKAELIHFPAFGRDVPVSTDGLQDKTLHLEALKHLAVMAEAVTIHTKISQRFTLCIGELNAASTIECHTSSKWQPRGEVSVVRGSPKPIRHAGRAIPSVAVASTAWVHLRGGESLVILEIQHENGKQRTSGVT